MRKIIFGLGILLFMASCRTIRVSDLQPGSPLSQTLPTLEPQIDMNSFHMAYTFGSTLGLGMQDGWGPPPYPEPWLGTFGGMVALPDRRIQDARVLFDREVRENITDRGRDYKGFLVCRIPFGETRVGGWGWLVLSSLTLTVPNWFGMPFYNYRTELQLEVEVRNCKDELLGIYSGYGLGRTPVALWHGYASGSYNFVTGHEPAARKSNIDAFKLAMEEVKLGLQRDARFLRAELEACRIEE
jgi:hypothetical protein